MREALINDILKENSNYTTSKWIIERIPHLFKEDLDLYIKWKDNLSSLIGVDSKAIVFTGSSSIGFSLNPEKYLKAFDEDSDIDVAVISNHYFDIAWHYLRNIGPKYYKLKLREKIAVDDHRHRLIYYGTIATDKIVQLLPYGKEWMNAMDQMRKIKPTEDRVINFRIYKDFEALKSYQTNGVAKVKDYILSK